MEGTQYRYATDEEQKQVMDIGFELRDELIELLKAARHDYPKAGQMVHIASIVALTEALAAYLTALKEVDGRVGNAYKIEVFRVLTQHLENAGKMQ